MSPRYIDFISAYCDSWCERCAFTQRCSHFAVTSAIAMCDGNFEAALELAIGTPRTPGGRPQKTLGERMAEALGNDEPTEKELDDIGREIDERDERMRRHPLAESSMDYAVASHRWLKRRGGRATDADPAVRTAIEVIGRDSHLIHVKIMRALDGRDEDPGGHWFDDDPVQSDWNGAAKVARISIERSREAWRAVADATGDGAAAGFAGTLDRLREAMDREFPRAREFRRPGFDDPPPVSGVPPCDR